MMRSLFVALLGIMLLASSVMGEPWRGEWVVNEEEKIIRFYDSANQYDPDSSQKFFDTAETYCGWKFELYIWVPTTTSDGGFVPELVHEGRVRCQSQKEI